MKKICALYLVLCTFFSAFAENGEDHYEENPEYFTKDVLLAIHYERYELALDLLIEKEMADGALTPQHQFLMAEAYSGLGSLKTALRIYNDLLKHDRENPQYLYKRALVHARLESWKKSHADCVLLRRLAPRQFSYCRVCGEIALEAARYADALNFLRCHLEGHTHDYEAQYLMAKAHLRLKNHHQALLIINECISVMPQMVEYHLLRAQIYEQQGLLNFAAEGYAVYLEQHPANHRVWLQYGLLLHKQGRKSEACQAFEQSKNNGNLDAGRYQHRFCR